jgi:integrase
MVNGQRVRRTLETSDWRKATQRERDLMKRATEGKLATGATAELARLIFDQAADRYLAEVAIQRPGSARKTAEKPGGDPRKSWEGAILEPARLLFEGKRLNQITADDIRTYQSTRLSEGKHPATINHEVKGLLRLLKRAKLASYIRDDVKLLSIRRASRQMLTANTSMRPVELRRLRWEDVDPFQRLLTVRLSKTDAGSRVIPINDEAYSAIEALKLRADNLKAYAPEYFVFPRQKPRLDPTRPIWNWRTAWRSLRQAAAQGNEAKGIQAMPRLAKLRYYDLRHQAITEMLEAGIPEGVIREVAGHVDPEMTRHYSHPRLEARRAAVQVLAAVKPTPTPATPQVGYGTNYGTKLLPAASEAN